MTVKDVTSLGCYLIIPFQNLAPQIMIDSYKYILISLSLNVHGEKVSFYTQVSGVLLFCVFLLGDTLSVIILLAVSPERGFFVKGQG